MFCFKTSIIIHFINMNKLLGLFAIIVILSLSVTAQLPQQWFPQSYRCEDCGCWERCFSNPPNPSFADEYARLYQFIQQIRAGRVLNGARSSVFFADLTTSNPSIFQLEKNLMKLAAFGLNAGRNCHPTTIVGYGRWGSFWWTPLVGTCLTACQLSHFIDYLPYQGSSWFDFLGPSCYLANFVMNLNQYQCRFYQQRYAVLFANNNPLFTFPTCSAFNFRSAVEISSSPTGFSSLPWLRNEITYSSSLLSASQNLINCMRRTCCPRTVWWRDASNVSVRQARSSLQTGIAAEESEEALPQGIIYYVDAADPTNVKETKEDLRQFLSKKENASPCSVAPDGRAEESFCNKELCQDPNYVKICPKNCETCPEIRVEKA